MIVYGYASGTSQFTTGDCAPSTEGVTIVVKYIDRWVTVVEYQKPGSASVIRGTSQPKEVKSKNKTPWVILPRSMKRSLGTIPQPLGKPLKPRPRCLLRQP